MESETVQYDQFQETTFVVLGTSLKFLNIVLITLSTFLLGPDLKIFLRVLVPS